MESKYSEYTVRGITYRYVSFDAIRNITDAYTIGYVACDGGFVENRGHPFMMVNSVDRSVLELFKNEYCPDSRIWNTGKKSSEKVTATNDCYEFRFAPKMRDSFSKFGVFCAKKNRRIVNIPDSMILPYAAGAMDSDGFITVSHRKDCRSPRLRWFITSCAENWLVDLQNKLDKIYGIPTTLRIHHANGKCFRLQSQNTEANIWFLSEMNALELPYRNSKKYNVVSKYLSEINFVPQASGELLEPCRESAAKPQVYPWKVQRLPEQCNLLNNRN
jgi:hypothetical protein